MVGAGAFHSMRHSYLSRSIPIVLIQYHIISENFSIHLSQARADRGRIKEKLSLC